MKLGKILIFNREKDKDDPIKQILRKYGHEVIERSIEGHVVLEVLDVMPHIILIKILDERKDDFTLEICKLLKNNHKTSHIPLIILLPDYDMERKLQYIRLGVRDYLQKPFDEKELILKIDNQLKYKKLEENFVRTRKALEESLATIKKQEIELNHNLTMASKIQEALIPKYLGNIPNCSFFWHFQPSGKVGGDIFDVFMLDENHMGLYVIDVMGHGVASSMLAVALSEFLIWDVDRGSPLKRRTNQPPYYEIISPLEVVNYLNKRFPFTRYQHYFTIFYMVLNIKTGVLKYVRAAHPMPILIRNSGEIIELDGYGTPVGFEFTEGYKEETVYLESGDNLIIYTDGLLELTGENESALEYEGLMKYLQKEVRYNFHNHYFAYNLSQMAKRQDKLKDDLSILEMKWVKFI